MEDNRNKYVGYPHKLNGNTLKWIALLSMLIDHIGVVLLSGGSHSLFSVYSLCRGIGRIAFPIFCFLLVEGFCHTSNVKKYILRMLGFACVAEIPYDLAFYGKIVKLDGQNVMFTFVIALVVLMLVGKREKVSGDWWVFVLAGCALAWFFSTDGSFFGIVLIWVFYDFRENHLYRNVIAGVTMCWQPTSLFTLPLVEGYNGERGRGSKYFFYWFYPLHLFVLWLLAR